jgi:cytoskeleton protein RodZ
MSNLGELLKAERIKKQISYDTITEHTRISEEVIRTLEEGNFSKMPSYVHAKNFVKTYANFLKLNIEEVEALLEEECKKEDYNREVHYVASPVTHEPIDRKSPMVYVIILIAIIALFIVGIFIYKSMSNNQALEQKETKMRITPSESVANDSEPNSVIAVAESFDNITDNATTVGSEGSPDTLDTAETTTETQQESAPATTTTAPATTQTPVVATPASTTRTIQNTPPQDLQRSVTLAFSDVCWVNIETDEGEVFDFIADKGLERTLKFKEYFILNLGNSAVVEVRDGSTRHRGFGEFRKPVRNLRFSYDTNGKLVYTRQN